MIRRNPTLIPMSDRDVQDVRDMVAKELETLQNQKVIMKKAQSLAEGPGMSEEGDESSGSYFPSKPRQRD